MQRFGGFLIRSFARVTLFAGFIGALVALPASAQGAAEKPKEDRNAIPASAMPPKGMCRVWLQDVAPTQQPAATDCATAIKNRPQNAQIVFGDLSGGDPFTPRRSNIRTSINNNTSAWPRDWPRDPIAYRTPTSSVDPNTRGQFRGGPAGPAGTTTAAAQTAGGVQTIRATQSAVVAQPTTPPPSKPPEKPQY